MSTQAQRAASAGRKTVQPFKELLQDDCAALKRYIKDGGSVEAREDVPPRRTLLHVACELRLATAARQLVEAGADVNAAADDGSTPLMSTQSADLAKLLLDSGADLELTDSRGRNALRMACEQANIEMTKLLSKRGSPSSTMQVASDGGTALCVAMNAANEALALLVLAVHPADYNANEVVNVDTNLYEAAGYGFVKLAEALLKRGADVNLGCVGELDRTPYMYAAQIGDLAMLDLLHQYGANVNAVAKDGHTALYGACNVGQALAVKRMLRHGVDVHGTPLCDGKPSPLYTAIMKGYLGVVKALLDAGALEPRFTELSLLEIMLQELDDDAAVPMLKLLLQHWSTDVNTVCDNGRTLIFSAVIYKRLKAACYLVSAGADVHVKTVNGLTVMHVAAQYDAVRILRWLVVTQKTKPCEAAAVDGWLPLHYACHMGSTAAAEYLLSLPQAAAMVTAESNTGCTALQTAAYYEHDDIVQLLLRKGAAVDTKCHTGATPLMYAQRLRTVDVPLSATADVNAVDDDGFTVLHHCAKQGAAECVYKLLLKHGAVPTAVDKNGSTPAHIAGMSGHFADEALLSKAANEYSKTHAATGEEKQRVVSSNGGGKQQQVDATTAIDSSSSSSGKQQQGDATTTAISSGISSSSSSATSSAAQSTSSSSSEAIHGSAKQKKQKVKQPCANCKKLTTTRCRRCAAVYYCSTECQKVCFKDAKHRAKCNEIASAIV
jgi:ankyrin repeat protein